MRELSLFSGAGGGLWGSKLLGWKSVGYVEYDDYCQQVIAARIADGFFEKAPIFGDIRAFISEGYADQYQGMVDVISAGFPCQPFSVAGKNEGEFDPRNMWPQTIDCIRRIRPTFAFLENVPGLLTHKYIQRIFGDLAESGYDCRWKVISAAEVGASHKRDRLWIVAHTGKGGWWPGKNSKICGSGVSNTSFNSSLDGQWEADPSKDTKLPMDRMVDGMADFVNRHEALGNGQCSFQQATAWNTLTGDWFDD